MHGTIDVVPRSLEDRRLAVAAALRAVAHESRLDALSSRLDDVAARLDSVETALLESTWDQPSQPPAVEAEAEEATVSVPALDLAEGRMSSVAAKALFGH